jgi:hypothetical protein
VSATSPGHHYRSTGAFERVLGTTVALTVVVHGLFGCVAASGLPGVISIGIFSEPHQARLRRRCMLDLYAGTNLI